MTERLLLAGIALLVILAAGLLVRLWSRHRNKQMSAHQSTGQASDGLPQIVSFFGPSCGACARQKRIIEELHSRDPQLASVRFVDAVAEADYALKFGVIVVPTTLVAASTGRIVGITCGLIGADALTEQLRLAA